MTASGTGTQARITLDEIASISATSEQDLHPAKSILEREGGGWRAATPGTQTIEIVFVRPRPVRRIQLHFSEHEQERTQQFMLQWAPTLDGMRTKILQQQWNFSPRGSTQEQEDFTVDLKDALVLELVVNPDVGGGSALASLDRLTLA